MTNDQNNAKAYLLAMHGEPWAIHPGRMQGFLDTLIVSDMTSEEMDERTGPRTVKIVRAEGTSEVEVLSEFLQLADRDQKAVAPTAIAVVPLHGPITHRSGLFSAFFGGTSTEKWGRMFDELMANPNIGAIVVDIDSPGGEVSGTPELAAKIFKARGTKPMVGVANAWAASGAYYLGTAFDELVVAPSGEVGSIGVWSMHMDYSAMLEMDGVKPTIISAGKFKVEFNQYEPLSDEAKAEEQTAVDHYHGDFVRAVAKQRGVTATVVRKEFGQGRMIRAKEAVERGMADRVATLEETIRRVGGMLNSKARARADAAMRDKELEELEGKGE